LVQPARREGGRAAPAELSGCRLSGSGKHVCRPVGTVNPFDQEDGAHGVLGSQRQDLLIGRRLVPVLGMGSIRELDDDHGSGILPLEHIRLTAVHDEVAVVRLQRGIDALQVLRDALAHPHVCQDPDSIGCHPSSSRAVVERLGTSLTERASRVR